MVSAPARIFGHKVAYFRLSDKTERKLEKVQVLERKGTVAFLALVFLFGFPIISPSHRLSLRLPFFLFVNSKLEKPFTSIRSEIKFFSCF